MTKLRLTSTYLFLFYLAGCQLLTTSQKLPARIPSHSQDSLVELRQSARMLVNDSTIIIGSTAFSKTSRLVIQRKPIRSPDGRIIDNRMDEKPFQLTLFLEGGDCFLQNLDSGKRVRLIKAECVALPP